MKGYDVNVIEKVSNILNCPIIASGGCGAQSYVKDVVKTCPNVSLAAVLFNSQRITLVLIFLKLEVLMLENKKI